MAAFVCLSLPCAASAQDAATPRRVTITGRVVDVHTRRPIPGVAVALAELSLLIGTDGSGAFEIRNVPVGVYELRMSAPGYHDATGDFAIVRPGSFTATLTPLGVTGDTPLGRLVGRVTGPGGEPALQGVRVQVPGVFLDGITGDDGRFAFDAVPPGRHAVTFTNLGWAPRTDTVEVVSGRTSDAHVSMAADPVELEPVEVTVERRETALERQGFYERRRVTNGLFIDREAIEAKRPMQMTDLFSGLNGVEIRLADAANPLTRAVILRGGRRELRRCYPSVYVDGLLVHPADSGPAMLDDLVAPDQVAGVEVYHGGASVPAQYGGVFGACGVIVVWTRG